MDSKICVKVKVVCKLMMFVGRLDKVCEGVLDYKLGLGVDDVYVVEIGEEGEVSEEG